MFCFAFLKWYCQDDPSAMDFVTSAANLRMHVFSMNMKSRFDIKCKYKMHYYFTMSNICATWLEKFHLL